MGLGIKHTLLRELRLRMVAYDFRRARHDGPVSAEPVLEIARQVADNYAEARREIARKATDRSRKIVAERKAKGLCRLCGEEPHRHDRTTCAGCGALEVERNRRQYDTMRRKEKRSE